MQFRSAFGHLGPHVVGEFHQRYRCRIGGCHEVAQVQSQPVDEELGVETFVAHLLVDEQRRRDILCQEGIEEPVVVGAVEYVQVGYGGLVCDVAPGACRHLVENGECVAHGAVGLPGNHRQCRRFGGYAFAGGHVAEVRAHVGNADAVEVENLATRENGRQYLVFLGGCENEDGVSRRLLEGFEECVEGRLA